MAIKAVVADDHHVIRLGIAKCLADLDIEVVGQACCGNQAVEFVKRHSPHLLLLDVRMPKGDGISALEKAKAASAKSKVIMISGFARATYVARSNAYQANAFLSKSTLLNNFAKTIQQVLEGKSPSECMMKKIRESMMSSENHIIGDELQLTKRELQVMRHLTYGLSNKEIGLSLEISIETVKEHVQNILRKAHANDRPEVAVMAAKRGLVQF